MLKYVAGQNTHGRSLHHHLVVLKINMFPYNIIDFVINKHRTKYHIIY
jgi:hypothetical protein